MLFVLALSACSDDGRSHVLDISVEGKGVVTAARQGIACVDHCRYSLPPGDRVTLVAAADAGHRLETWGGACSGDACELTMTEDRTVEATFGPLAEPDRVQKSTLPGARTNDVIHALDIRGDLAIAGMRNTSLNPAAEAAHIFERRADGWHHLVTLEAAEAGNLGFGEAVAIDGDWAVVGARWDVGAVFFFRRESTGWSRVKIDGAGTANAQFGTSVAIEGTTALVGEPGDNRVHVLELQGGLWNETGAPLTRPGRFGHAVALDGETILVSALNDGVRGAAYVFQRNGDTWQQTARLEPTTGDNFGQKVALQSGLAMVASYGKAFVFERTGATWIQTYSLPLDNTAADLAGNTLITGDTLANKKTGAVRVARRVGGTWVPGSALAAFDGQAGDELGSSITLSVDTVIAATSSGGALYFFELIP